MDELSVGILFVLAGVVGYLVLLLRKLIVAKIGQEKYDFISQIIEDIVRSVEQKGVKAGWTGEDKKRMAVNLSTAALEKLGYDVEGTLIGRLIERAVQVKREKAACLPDKDLLKRAARLTQGNVKLLRRRNPGQDAQTIQAFGGEVDMPTGGKRGSGDEKDMLAGDEVLQFGGDVVVDFSHSSSILNEYTSTGRTGPLPSPWPG
mgnify:CR=1 FL=1